MERYGENFAYFKRQKLLITPASYDGFLKTKCLRDP